MRTTWQVLRLTVAAIAVVTAGAASGSPLLQQSTSVPILLPAEALGSERLAAEELAHYLGRLLASEPTTGELGARPAGPAVIVCRADRVPAWGPAAELAEQEFRIKTDGDTVWLTGGGHRGVLYAAYAFLEDVCGVHWFYPGPYGEVVPPPASINVPELNRRERPAFAVRSLMDHKIEDKEAVLVWMLRNRLTPDRGRNRKAPGTRAFYERMATYGLEPSDLGQNRIAGHVFNRALPVDTHFKTHPQWFPHFNGQNFPGGRNSRQPTLHAKGFAEFMLDVVRKGFDSDPDLEAYSLCPNDGFNGWGNHPADTEWDGGEYWGALPVVTDRLMHFASGIARQVAESHPGRRVYTYAYTMRYKQPPVRFTDLPPNLDIDLVHQYNAHCDHLRSITDPRSRANANFRPYLESWRKVVKGKLLYRSHCCLSAGGMIYPTWHTVQDTYRYLREQKLDGVEHGIHRAYGHNGFAIWLCARLSWNPDLDVAVLKKTYCEGMFGREAAPHMAAYVDRIRQAALECRLECATSGMKNHGFRIFPEPVLHGLDDRLTAAETVVRGEAHAWNVQLVRLAYDIHADAVRRARDAGLGIDYRFDRAASAVTPLPELAGLRELFALDDRVRNTPQGRFLPEVVGGRSRARLQKRLEAAEAEPPSAVPVVLLESDALQVLVAPGLSARILQITERSSNATVFKGLGGNYGDGLGPAFGWLEWGYRDAYELVERDANRLVFRAQPANGVEYTRTYELEGHTVRITLNARNAGDQRAPFRFLIKPLMRIGRSPQDRYAYVWQEDGWRRCNFLENIYSSQWLTGKDVPHGAWAIADDESSVAVINRFDRNAVDFCLLWNSSAVGYTMEMASPLITLKPGETASFAHSYDIVTDSHHAFRDATPFQLVDTRWH